MIIYYLQILGYRERSNLIRENYYMTNHVATYPSDEQLERWEERADEMGISMSRFVESMTEAGMKTFSRDVEPDESAAELRQERNELLNELETLRQRVEFLEQKAYTTEREKIEGFVKQNPGAVEADIEQAYIQDAPSRVQEHIEALIGETIDYADDEGYVYIGDDE